MRGTFLLVGLTSALLVSFHLPSTLAAPKVKHHHNLHQPSLHPATLDGKSPTFLFTLSSRLLTFPGAVSDIFVNSTILDVDHHLKPVIFEHKHQRLFKAGPNDPAVREIFDDKVVVKRDIDGGIVLVTKYKTVLVPGNEPTDLPHMHLGGATGKAESTSKPHTTLIKATIKIPTPEASPTVEEPIQERSVIPAKVHMMPTDLTGIMQSISYAAALATPVAQGGQYLGSVTQDPVMKFIPHNNELIPILDDNLLGSGVNDALITTFDIYNGSGSLILTKIDTTEPLTQVPWMSRDNGRGGYLNGHQIFMYADTGVTILDKDNAFGGFVSTSVAVDKGRMAAQGQAPILQDMMGEWDNNGALPRGFVPFTLGEAAYTGQSGKRYAIWPESSLIYLTSETALCYAAIVYIDTAAENLFADVGNTLLKIRVPSAGGPVASRPVPLMFGADEINFGVIGGIRSWGKSGPGGRDGKVYVFGNGGPSGLLLGRVHLGAVEQKSAYEYFNNDTQTWSPTAPSKTDPAGVFIDGAHSTADMFYSPRHLTFIMVYQTPYADNSFWWRYLLAPTAIKPRYAGGSDDDIVENVHRYAWSEPELLFSAPKPSNGGYIYAGGVQMGYFDGDDVVNGGTKMLLQWTAPVANDDPHGYETGTAVVTFA